MRIQKTLLIDLLAWITIFSISGFIAVILVTGLWLGSAGAEKYKNATGEIVEMPKGMKPPPKQAWDTTPYKLPTSSGGKSTPTTTTQKQPAPVKKSPVTTTTASKTPPPVQKTSTTTTKKQPVTVQKPSPTPVQKTTTTSNKQPAPVQKPSSIPTTATKATPPGIKSLTPPGQKTPTPMQTRSIPTAATTTSPGMVQDATGQGQPPLSGIIPQSSPERLPSTSKSRTLSKDSQTSPGSTSFPEETIGENKPASDSGDSSGEGGLPPWTPAAAGAAAGGVAAIGSLLAMTASGVRPREVWDEVKDLLTQRSTAETASDDQEATDRALQELDEQRSREKAETQQILKEEAKRDEQEAAERAHVEKRVRYLMEGDIFKENLQKQEKLSQALTEQAMTHGWLKTICTCRYPDGSFSYSMAGIHMATSLLSTELLPALTYTKGFLTLTPSTCIFGAGNASYMYDDYRAAGYSPIKATMMAATMTVGTEVAASGIGHGLGIVAAPLAKGVGKGINCLAEDVLGISGKSAVKETGEAVETAVSSAGKVKLSPTQYEMRTAAATMKTLTNGTVEEQKIAAKDMLRLSQDVKAELERTGKINPAQVKIITDAQTRISENALDEATPKAMEKFTEKTGVKLEKATVANQSSARAWSQRSLETTDEDRTVFLKFDKESYDNYVKNEFKGDEAAAQNALNNTYKEVHDKNMDAALAKQGVTRGDVKYGTYVGTGGTKGEVNLPTTRTEVAHQTSPTPAKEFEVNPETGKIGPPKSKSQQSIFDEKAMDEYKKSGTPPPETGTKITAKDAEQQVKLYRKKLTKGDMGPYDAAKGYQRYCKGLAILKKPYDRDLLDQCLKVTNHPTDAMKDLGPQGQAQLMEKITRAVH